jgi:beta-N-acetylhexosaminidase
MGERIRDAALGPVMLDVAGVDLAPEERELLCHPLVGGVILFTRNFESAGQLRRLCQAIHALRAPPLLIAVDHEGGRVQRFRQGFTALPPMRALGHLWDRDAAGACAAAEAVGYVLAAELRDCGVDLSFTPVLDLEYGASSVIGDRAFHGRPHAVAALAGALLGGLRAAGMSGVGKHFPGHGFVSADSHTAVPLDVRGREAIEAADMLPFRLLAASLGGVMPAHVVYEAVDPRPAGFSAFWLQTVLRSQLGFRGVVFSDDLSMEGASTAGGVVERAEAARSAGCDMVLVCNDRAAALRLLENWHPAADAAAAGRIASLIPPAAAAPFAQSARYREALSLFDAIPKLAVRGDGCMPECAE